MTQTMLASIERTCALCGASNKILATEIRSCWNINCSRCGGPIVERRTSRLAPVQPAQATRAEARKAG